MEIAPGFRIIQDPHPISIYWELPLGSESLSSPGSNPNSQVSTLGTHNQFPYIGNCPWVPNLCQAQVQIQTPKSQHWGPTTNFHILEIAPGFRIFVKPRFKSKLPSLNIGDPQPISIYWKLPLGSESFRTHNQFSYTGNCPWVLNHSGPTSNFHILEIAPGF